MSDEFDIDELDEAYGDGWSNGVRSERVHSARDRDEILEALRSLYDQQNGPPLIREQEHWQAAYDKAGTLLRRYGK